MEILSLHINGHLTHIKHQQYNITFAELLALIIIQAVTFMFTAMFLI